MKSFLLLIVASALLVSLSVGSRAQSPLAFEVVSIKPDSQLTPELIMAGSIPSFTMDGTRVRITHYSMLGLLTAAFRLPPMQIDAPAFIRDQYFEIQATLPAGATRAQVPEMLQAMLAERFKLAYHRETREYRMNVLTVGRDGMKLQRLPDGAPTALKEETLPNGVIRQTQTGPVSSLFAVMNSFGGLQMQDETGLDGNYTWVRYLPAVTPDMTFRDRVQEAFKAMIEAAGLRMETRTIPKETIVVDHIEKTPTAN